MSVTTPTPPAPVASKPLPPESPECAREGFSLVELVIALVILAVGVLGMAGTTAYVVRSITLADLNTERAAALQTAIEQIRAQPFLTLASGTDTVGDYTVKWEVTSPSPVVRNVLIETLGPGLQGSTSGPPVLSPQVYDTFQYTVVRP